MVTKLTHRILVHWSQYSSSHNRPASLRGHADGCNHAGHRSAFSRPPRRSIAWKKVPSSRPRDVASLCVSVYRCNKDSRVDGVNGFSIWPRSGVLILCSSRKVHEPQATHSSQLTTSHPAALYSSLSSFLSYAERVDTDTRERRAQHHDQLRRGSLDAIPTRQPGG